MGQREMITYEYGAVSSCYSIRADNKLTAYAAMVLHFGNSANMIAIYKPETSKVDSWLNFGGDTVAMLDEVFGGDGAFAEYLEPNIEAIKACMKTRKQLV